MNKKDFLKELSSMSKEEIDRLIKREGKEPKYIDPVYFDESKIIETEV